MGPRARARGNIAPIVDAGVAFALQRGHERALVEIANQLQSIAPMFLLQWGHERALVEITRRSRNLDRARAASMGPRARARGPIEAALALSRSEEHTSELQSPCNLVC